MFLSDNLTRYGSMGYDKVVFPGRCKLGHDRYELHGEDEPMIFPDFLLSYSIPKTTLKEYEQGGRPVSILTSKQRSRQYVFSFQRHKPNKVGGWLFVESKWNCSKSAFPGLYLHFPCDLYRDCQESEDETH
eukprot:TRINITY_DN51742_c0_g1_i2.p1 TRINITY_DN51742_c0_g1~~TRINITY_DN51742_c0_g1_i2.p1  ORF type:complete len:131 (+),score=3.62 TRINITY_DN51742_c0_g1_i2:243-635(+)